ncbi:MAG: helix-turn-helix domain-containing protein [Candidatus Kariarchaeaceae archaeon]|jgi:sugar-specific transcriptional regulator TrmB
MSRKHLLPPENEDYLERLGFTNNDKKVYVAILDSGLVSVGEIQQLTELELGKVLESIRDLVDIGLVKKAQGKMPRYYASLPFFRETVSVEREALITLEEMLKSLNQTKENIEKERTNITTVKFPQIRQTLLDGYYDTILSPTVKQLEEIRDNYKEKKVNTRKTLQDEKEIIKSAFTHIIKPVKAFNDLQSQKFEITLTDEGNSLEQYLTQRKAQRIKTLKSTHEYLGAYLGELREITSNFIDVVKLEFENITKINSLIIEIHQNLTDIITKVKAVFTDLKETKDELHAEFITVREKLIASAMKDTSKKGPKGVSVDEINEGFTVLGELLKKTEVNQEPIINSLDTSLGNTSNVRGMVTEAVDTIKMKIDFINSAYVEKIQNVTDKMSDTLNSINTQDDEGLDQVKAQLVNDIDKISDSIKQSGKEVGTKIEEFNSTMENNLNSIFGKWEESTIVLYEEPQSIIAEFLENWVDEIKPVVEKFNQSSEGMVSEILKPVKDLEETTFASLIERISFVKAIIESRDTDLQNLLEFSKTFDYTKSSDTWVVVGLPSIYASLTDLLMRTRVKVTVVSPKIDLELVEIAKKMKPTIRITFVADIDKEKDARVIKKIEEEEGRITLRAYKEKDLYACMRDSEEIIFGYETSGEEMIGIRTSTPSMVELLEDRLNETVIRNSKSV